MSTAWNVTLAVKKLAVDALETSVLVAIRKKLQHDKGFEAVRSVVIVPEKPRKGEQSMRAKLDVLYGFLVAIVQERGIREQQAQWWLDTEETLRHALFVTSLPGVTSVRDCEWEPDAAADLSSWDEKFDVSVSRFVYASHEARNPS